MSWRSDPATRVNDATKLFVLPGLWFGKQKYAGLERIGGEVKPLMSSPELMGSVAYAGCDNQPVESNQGKCSG